MRIARQFEELDDLRRWPAVRWWAFVVLVSLAFAIWLLSAWPTALMYDDGGIVLRYMDNFAAGAPYRYNVDDPPVFGVSGFVHATVAGACAASGVLSPASSLHGSGLLGVLLSGIAVFLILRAFTRSALALLLGWAFTISASHYFITNAFQGLETPLHVGIVLLTVWAFLAGRARLLWPLMALSVISKLDAVPVVLVLAGLRAAQLRSVGALRVELRRAAVGAGLPLLLWVGFATAFFGSPLPQSAFAKLEFHAHPPARIGFVTEWWKRDELRILAYWLFIASALAVAFRRSTQEGVRLLALPVACLAVLGLYVAYNPGERMPWYYALPQMLLALAAVGSLLALVEPRGRRLVVLIAILVLGVALPENIRKTARWSRGAIEYIRTVEPERMAVGDFVHERAAPDERLMTGHGYVARNARIHTYDLSGLNSPEVTRCLADGRDPILVLQPDWIAYPAVLPRPTQAQEGYRLESVFYDRSARGFPAWRVWRRADGPAAVPALAEEIVAAGVEDADDHRALARATGDATRAGLLRVEAGDHVEVSTGRFDIVEALCFGVARIGAAVQLRVFVAGELVQQDTIPAIDPGDRATGLSAAFRVELGAAEGPVQVRLEFRGGDPGQEPIGMRILEPVWLVRGATGA